MNTYKNLLQLNGRVEVHDLTITIAFFKRIKSYEKCTLRDKGILYEKVLQNIICQKIRNNL